MAQLELRAPFGAAGTFALVNALLRHRALTRDNSRKHTRCGASRHCGKPGMLATGHHQCERPWDCAAVLTPAKPVPHSRKGPLVSWGSLTRSASKGCDSAPCEDRKLTGFRWWKRRGSWTDYWTAQQELSPTIRTIELMSVTKQQLSSGLCRAWQ